MDSYKTVILRLIFTIPEDSMSRKSHVQNLCYHFLHYTFFLKTSSHNEKVDFKVMNVETTNITSLALCMAVIGIQLQFSKNITTIKVKRGLK